MITTTTTECLFLLWVSAEIFNCPVLRIHINLMLRYIVQIIMVIEANVHMYASELETAEAEEPFSWIHKVFSFFSFASSSLSTNENKALHKIKSKRPN